VLIAASLGRQQRSGDFAIVGAMVATMLLCIFLTWQRPQDSGTLSPYQPGGSRSRFR
jgi:hypothetical protein